MLVWTTVVHVCVCGLDAQPTEGEREVWNQVNSVLQDSESILMGLQAYKGAGQEIRDVRNLSSVYGCASPICIKLLKAESSLQLTNEVQAEVKIDCHIKDGYCFSPS